MSRIRKIFMPVMLVMMLVLSSSGVYAATLGTNTKGATNCSWRAWHTYSTSQTPTTFTVNYTSATVKNDVKKTTDTFTVQTQIVNGSGTSKGTTGVVATGASKKMTAHAKGYYNFKLTGCSYTFQKKASAYTVAVRVSNKTEASGNRNYINLTVPALQQFSISLNADGGQVSQTKLTGYVGEPFNLPTPTKEGYSFNGWFNSNGSQVYSGTFQSNMTLTARWTQNPVEEVSENSYIVYFDAIDISEDPEPQTVAEGSTASEPATPVAEGYTFDGWYNADGSVFDFSTPIYDDTFVYAQWLKDEYTISYDVNGGITEAPESQTKLYGEAITLTSATPYRIGYKFMGWETPEGNVYASNSTFEEDASVTLSAQWTKKALNMPTDGVVYLAHKGYAAIAPENTLPAYEEAVAAGFTGVELDVWETSAKYNNQPYFLLSHNKNLQNYTGKSVDITTLTNSSRKSYPIVNGKNIARYGQQTVPSLDEALTTIWRAGSEFGNPDVAVELDIKQSTISDAAITRIVSLIGNHPARINTSSSAVAKKFLAKKKSNTQVWMYSGSKTESAAKTFIKSVKTAGAIGVSMPPANWTNANIQYAKSLGLKLAAYTNDKTEISRLKSAGFERICVNKPVW